MNVFVITVIRAGCFSSAASRVFADRAAAITYFEKCLLDMCPRRDESTELNNTWEGVAHRGVGTTDAYYVDFLEHVVE